MPAATKGCDDRKGKGRRAANFLAEEDNVIVGQVCEAYDKLLCKLGGVTAKDKQAEWDKITAAVNA